MEEKHFKQLWTDKQTDKLLGVSYKWLDLTSKVTLANKYWTTWNHSSRSKVYQIPSGSYLWLATPTFNKHHYFIITTIHRRIKVETNSHQKLSKIFVFWEESITWVDLWKVKWEKFLSHEFKNKFYWQVKCTKLCTQTVLVLRPWFNS